MKKILILDDNELNITILEGILEKKFIIHVAKDGADAIDRISKESFDLVILDIMMPDMSGIEVCETIKKNESKNSTPIIFLSAAADDTNLRKSVFDAGAVDFISKPFKASCILERIDSVFKNQG